jgi:hypothetical protein
MYFFVGVVSYANQGYRATLETTEQDHRSEIQWLSMKVRSMCM